jgi:hypothetical protein
MRSASGQRQRAAGRSVRVGSDAKRDAEETYRLSENVGGPAGGTVGAVTEGHRPFCTGRWRCPRRSTSAATTCAPQTPISAPATPPIPAAAPPSRTVVPRMTATAARLSKRPRPPTTGGDQRPVQPGRRSTGWLASLRSGYSRPHRVQSVGWSTTRTQDARSCQG